MSYSPFDGVLLEDSAPVIPGAVAMLLHLRVAKRLAASTGLPQPGLEAVEARAGACQELLSHGLYPGTLRDLKRHGLDLGDSRAPHSLRNLVAHLEAYLIEVEKAGFLEPDHALWLAVDRHLENGRGFWIERTEADGLLAAGMKDLVPARLRALACIPTIGGAQFSLATRKGDSTSGLFGSSQPMVEWFLDGLEHHGHSFPNELYLEEPEGWGRSPWGTALERLFDGPLVLAEHAGKVQRGLVEGPVELLRLAVEQVRLWMASGIEAHEITLIHPDPLRAASLLQAILAPEGIPLHVRGGLRSLLESETWSPLWMLLQGLLRLDPCTLSAGLRASQRKDLRRWAEVLSTADQDGLPPFTSSFVHMKGALREGAEGFWKDLSPWRGDSQTAKAWADRLESLAEAMRLDRDPDDFYSPMGLLKEIWGAEQWTFPEMLMALRAFLNSARSARVPRHPEGLRLISPSALFEDWPGSRATLVLDLSEGAWPATSRANPDLDWDRKAAINQALVSASRGDEPFPPALQRFWLPRSEGGDQIPRAFQKEAYGFNLALALTSEHFVALSPAQDKEGRKKAQGPFWTALEGAGSWELSEGRIASRLRWAWEGHEESPTALGRAIATQARTAGEGLLVPSPDFDQVPEARMAWMGGKDSTSPTSLEALARCPFRSLAERVWRLNTFDVDSHFRMASGTLAHDVMEAALHPFKGNEDWPSAFRKHHALGDLPGVDTVLPILQELWRAHRQEWLARLEDVPEEQWPQLELDLEDLLPNLASALLDDLETKGPTKWEVALLYPDRLALAEAQRRIQKWPLQTGWTRALVSLEDKMEPIEFLLENGRTLRVSAKMDRLERWEHAEEGKVFLRVTDYKTTKKARLSEYAKDGAPFGAYLQTPLYALMAERAHGLPATAALVPLRESDPEPYTNPMGELAKENAEGQGWKDRLIHSLSVLEGRLEAGDFPPTPGKHCHGCPLGALCGRPVDVESDEDDDEAED